MADIKQITVNDVTYTIKDQSAREAAGQAQNTANGAKSSAEAANSAAKAAQTDVNNLANESLKASYNAGDESLVLSKGISV